MYARPCTASPGRWSSLLAALAALLCSACAAGGQGALAHPSVAELGPPALAGLLPAVAALPQSAPDWKPRAASAASIIWAAANVDNLLPNHEAYASMIDGTESFSASGAPGGPLSGYAYAVYSIDISAYSGPEELHINWRPLVPPANRAWIGLANYSSGLWEWHANPADGRIAVPGLAGAYHNGLGLLRIAVVCAGPASWVLDSICLGDNAPPVGDLGPAYQRYNFNAVVTLDASGSFDPDGSIVKYEFDPEGDGSFVDKGLSTQITHKYGKGGDWLPQLRVTDNEGAVTSISIQLVIGWAATMNGPSGSSEARALDFSADGQLLCAGLLGGLGQGGAEAYVGKYSKSPGSDGRPTPFWEKTYGTAGNDFFSGVAGDDWGDAFACGILGWDGFSGTGVLLRLDAAGNLVWQKQWDMPCQGFPVCAVDSQNYIYFASEVDNGVGNPSTVFAAKLDNSGAILWQAEFANGESSFMYNLSFDNLDEPYLAGSGYGLSGEGRDGLLIALNASGDLRFSRYFNAGLDEEFTAVCFDGAQLYIGGTQEGSGGAGECLLCAADLLGNLNWAKTYSTSPSYEGIYGNAWPLPGGGCLMSGVARDSLGALEALLLNVQPDGSLLWQSGFGLAGNNDDAYCLVYDGLGQAYFCGVLEAQSGAGYSELSGVLADIAPASLVDAGGAVSDNSHTLTAASGSLAALAGESHGNGGAALAQYFTPQIF